MPYESKLPQVVSRHNKAVDKALIAAAYLMVGRTSELLRKGYRGGQYVTPDSSLRVTRSEPMGPLNSRFILYGTDSMVSFWWEMGFWKWPAYYSEKLGRWVSVKGVRDQKTWYREERWMPLFLQSRGDIEATFARVYKEETSGGGGSGTGTQRAASPRSPDAT